ncbi:3D domain protein [compost metagenome]
MEGFGVVVAEDTGGAIKGKYRFDLNVKTKSEARQLGIKKLKVYVLKGSIS